jgi:hypothetical protein
MMRQTLRGHQRSPAGSTLLNLGRSVPGMSQREIEQTLFTVTA